MLKQRIIIALVMLFGCMTIFAQKATITGTVKTADGQSAEAISVYLKNTLFGTHTDSKGNFKFEAPAGEYDMIVYSIIVHQKEFPVTIKSDGVNNFPDITIIENAKQLEEVVVTGQFSPQSLQKSLYKVKVINNQTIRQKAATNLESLLNTEIGIRLNNDMALGETDIEIMGMSGQNVKVLIDGIPMVDRSSNKQSLSQIDVNTIERVEIVEGPMSVVYGADALAGIINIITKKNAAKDGKRLSFSTKIQEESVGSEYSVFAGKGRHNENINGGYTFKNGIYTSANFSRNAFGGWQGDLTGRKKQWQPKDQYLMGGKLGYAADKINAWYRLDYLNENILTEDDINAITNLTSDKEFMVQRYTHQVQGEYAVDKRLSISATGSYQDYHRRTRTTMIHTDNWKRELSMENGAQAAIDYNILFGRATATWTLLPNLAFQPGLEYQSSTGTGDRIDGARTINNAAFFLSAEYTPIEWLNIRPGVRASHNSAYDAPLFVPSLNVKFNICKPLDLRLSYAQGYRAPSLQELYYSFHDTNHNIDGNPDLRAEYSNSYMASLTGRILHKGDIRLTSTLSGFFNDFRDRISLMDSYATAGYYTYYNVDKYQTTGFTIENSLTRKSLRANLGISYVGRMNRYYDNEQYRTTEMSRFRFATEISSNIAYDWEHVASFSFYYKMTGARQEYTLSGNELKLLGLETFHWADFSVSRMICSHFNVQAGIKNLFNVNTVRNTASGGGAHGGGSGVVHSGCGRSYFMGIVYNL